MDWPSTILIPAEKGWYRRRGLAGSMDNGDFMGFNGDLVEFNCDFMVIHGIEW